MQHARHDDGGGARCVQAAGSLDAGWAVGLLGASFGGGVGARWRALAGGGAVVVESRRARQGRAWRWTRMWRAGQHTRSYRWREHDME